MASKKASDVVIEEVFPVQPKRFVTAYEVVPDEPVKLSRQGDKTVRSGYRSVPQQIAELTRAGKQLDYNRRMLYQHPEGEIPDYVRPANYPHDWDVHDQRALVADMDKSLHDKDLRFKAANKKAAEKEAPAQPAVGSEAEASE